MASIAAKKYRIAVLAAMPYPTPQGSQVFIGSLVYALKKAGHDITFLTYPIADGRLTAINRGQGKILRSGPSVAKAGQDILLLKNTLSELAQKRPELLYVHNYEALVLGLLIGFMANIPVLYHAHNVMSEELPHYFSSFESKLLARFGGKALDFLPAMAAKILLFSQTQTDLLSAHFVPEEKIAIIPPGLLAKEPPDLFWQKEPKEQPYKVPEAPYFLYTGNCDSYQNLALLAKAFALVQKSLPKCRLIFLTSAPPPKEFLKSGGRYIPLNNQRLMVDLLNNALALVVPRSASFGFPIKVLQALRAGTPVIGLKKSLSQLLLPHEALLCDDSPEALSAAMIKLAKNKALRERLSHQSLITFNERFALEKQVKEYTRLFASLIKD